MRISDWSSDVCSSDLKVLTSQALPQLPGQPAVYRSLVGLLNTAQAGSTLDIDSPQPLRIGTLLSAQVQDAQTLKFVRSEERRVGKECVGKCRSRWSP